MPHLSSHLEVSAIFTFPFPYHLEPRLSEPCPVLQGFREALIAVPWVSSACLWNELIRRPVSWSLSEQQETNCSLKATIL